MLGFYMVEIYTGRRGSYNVTEPYDFVSEVLNILHVRIASSQINSWDNTHFAPRHQLAIL